MSSSVLQELEELRRVLRSPRPSVSGTKSELGTTEATQLPGHYKEVLKNAEGRIARLSNVLSAANEGSEAVQRATTDLHRSNLHERDLEAQRLRRALEEQQSETERFREALSQTRTSLHERLRELEDVLVLRQAENARLHEALQATSSSHAQLQRDAAAARDQLSQQEAAASSCQQKLEAALAAMTSERDSAHRNAAQSVQHAVESTKADWKVEREQLQAGQAEVRLQASQRLTDLTEQYNRAARNQAEEHASTLEAMRKQHAGVMDHAEGQHTAALKALKQQHGREMEELQKQCRKSLKAAARRSSQSHHQEMELALGDVREQLHAERKRRKSLEGWMRSELKAREETDMLLVAMRDLINSRSKPQGPSHRQQPQHQEADQAAEVHGEQGTSEGPGLIPARVSSPGRAAATAADRMNLTQQIPSKQALNSTKWPDQLDLNHHSDLDQVQQALTLRLAKLLKPSL